MSTPRKKRIAVLTGGGDCPGLNPVIRSVAETAMNIYGYSTLGFLDGFEGLYYGKYHELCNDSVSDILSVGGTILGTTNRGHYSLPLSEDAVERAVATYQKLELSCIVMIGGDGTMSIGHELSKRGINFVGVPKTIDNDLQSTDQTFGFDSAVSVVTECLDRLHTTAASHHRVMVVEVMGRNAGWIALHSGVAGGASVILLPEVAWTWENVVRKVKDRVESHKYHYCLVVVSEGVRLPESGEQILKSGLEAGRPEVRLGGVGAQISAKIAHLTGFECREAVLGHIQRGGSPTCFDRILSTKFGTAAAKLACEGHYGNMVALKGINVESVKVTGEMKTQRTVNPENDQLVWSARAVGISFGDGNDLLQIPTKN